MKLVDEVRKTEVDGVVVTVPSGEKAYLIAEVRKAFGKEKEIIPFEKVPIESRIIEALHRVGVEAGDIAKRIAEIWHKKKEEVT